MLANRQAGNLHAVKQEAEANQKTDDRLTAYIYGEFNAPVKIETVNERKRSRLVATTHSSALEFRYGVSFISVEQAEKNLRHEIPEWGFDHIKDSAKARWNETLGRITVEGGSEAQRKVFYTALYRCFERMINISEDGQYYSAFDHKVHRDPRPF